MANHDVIAVGASAGGFQALSEIAKGLESDFPAAILVTIHLHPEASNLLADLIDRAGPLPASFARDGEEVAPGGIYLAPPDLHLLVDDGRMLLRRGPRENGARPAIDPMFRSVALHYGSRAIGVILTGGLNDGSSGLHAIKRRGGIAVVQDPRDARDSEMPASAIAATAVDHVVPLADMPALLARLVTQPARPGPAPSEDLRHEVAIAAQRDSGMAANDRLGDRSLLTCPECHGLLWEIRDGELIRYRCHVGHAFTLGALDAEQATGLDRALASALRALNERLQVVRRLADEAKKRQHDRMAKRWESHAREYEHQAAVIRAALMAKPPENGEQREAAPERDQRRVAERE